MVVGCNGYNSCHSSNRHNSCNGCDGYSGCKSNYKHNSYNGCWLLWF